MTFSYGALGGMTESPTVCVVQSGVNILKGMGAVCTALTGAFVLGRLDEFTKTMSAVMKTERNNMAYDYLYRDYHSPVYDDPIGDRDIVYENQITSFEFENEPTLLAFWNKVKDFFI